MSGYYNIGAGSDAESIRAIDRALDLGVTPLDTAEIYGPTATRSWSAGLSRAAATRRVGDEVRHCVAFQWRPRSPRQQPDL